MASLREAARLRAQFDLDLFTVALLLGYLQRIARLEHQLRSLQAHVPYPQHLPREGPAPWREPSLAVFRRDGYVLCKRMPCRTERGDCLFHLGTPFEG